MRQSQRSRTALLVAFATLLAACSGVSLRERDAAQHARLRAYAGAPVREFTWLTSHHGRSALSSDQLVAWADINKPYLLTVAQPCPNLMLARHIGITSTQDTVITRMSYVHARGFRCEVTTIQPVDYPRMLRDLRQKQAHLPTETGR